MIKAAREGKQHTSWVDPDLRYERALTTHVAQLARSDPFRQEMAHLLSRIGPAAATNSLSAVILKSVSPGVPDFYQGSEMWDFTLTDPDNRHPVDFARLHGFLNGIPELEAPGSRLQRAKELLGHWPDGRIKLSVTRSLLHLRRERPALFDQGRYIALTAGGSKAPHAVGLARRFRRQWVLAIVPRLVIGLAGPGRFPTGAEVWGDSVMHLPDGAPTCFIDLFTGASVEARNGRLLLRDCLVALPVAVLVARA
jgi:(1->4)-alpha-D-glucan 1-alpha-D-glucosylmutase